jgi:hypothetical protein
MLDDQGDLEEFLLHALLMPIADRRLPVVSLQCLEHFFEPGIATGSMPQVSPAPAAACAGGGHNFYGVAGKPRIRRFIVFSERPWTSFPRSRTNRRTPSIPPFPGS